MTTRTYEDAIACLNTLQSNAAEIAAASALPILQRRSKKLDLVREYLNRMGYSPEDLNTLNVIHITGTKGKGSTCALVDSVLRSVNPSWNVGLYTSPHLIAVRERIRLNGLPLSEGLFVKYFFEVWDKLGSCGKEPTYELPLRPMYFRFLTIMAFHVFISLKVDATILEVGIGGLLDDTNVVSRPIVTGVSSIGYDHMNVLGCTLREIATQKGGIFKIDVPALTVKQPHEAMEALRVQARERKASEFSVIELTEDIKNINVGIPGAHQKENAALAVRLAETFIKSKEPSLWVSPSDSESKGGLPRLVVDGLIATKWPGRCQIVADTKDERITWYLDGAHTEESLQCCLEWFVSPDVGLRTVGADPRAIDRTLVFNCTKGRNVEAFLKVITTTIRKQLEKYEMSGNLEESLFMRVVFCTNATYADGGFKKDLLSVNLTTGNGSSMLAVQNELADAWFRLFPGYPKDRVHILPSIEHAVQLIRSESQRCHDGQEENRNHVLVTGSLHLVGGLIEAAALSSAVSE